MRPWKWRQQFHQKINNDLKIDRGSYPSKLGLSCPNPIACNKCWHVTQLRNACQVCLETIFLPRFHTISRKIYIMDNRSHCSRRIKLKFSSLMFIHIGSSTCFSEICFNLVCVIITVFWDDRWFFRKSFENLEWL